jgi:hypothetical protein
VDHGRKGVGRTDTQAYKQFSQAAVVSMMEVVAKCVVLKLLAEVPEMTDTPLMPVDAFVGTGNWTREQLKLAFYFYCQTPFGKLHSRNPKIIELARLIGRTPDALAMKLVNFASLDPSITSTGRKGLRGSSRLDREIWDEFHADWEGLAIECERLHLILMREQNGIDDDSEPKFADLIEAEDFSGETRAAITQQRVKQRFFRRAVLSSYRGRCCMSGLSEPRLLVASHIVPWRSDKSNRLNPSNGLCLSAIHDKAFDIGLISLSDDLRVLVSKELLRRGDEFVERTFSPINGRQIELPERFRPDIALIQKHRSVCFKED